MDTKTYIPYEAPFSEPVLLAPALMLAQSSVSGSMSTGASTFYAAYLYSSVSRFSTSSKKWYTGIPVSQVIPAGESVDPAALVSVCKFTLGSSLNFVQAVSLVKFTLSSSDITRLVLSSTSGSSIAAGTVLTLAETGVSSVSSGTGSSSITLTHASGAFPAGDYYFACLPATLASGLSVTLTDTAGNESVKSSSVSVALAQGGGINLGDLNATSSGSGLAITSADGGDTSDDYKLYIYNGATVVAYGGLESNYVSTSTIYSMSATANSRKARAETAMAPEENDITIPL